MRRRSPRFACSRRAVRPRRRTIPSATRSCRQSGFAYLAILHTGITKPFSGTTGRPLSALIAGNRRSRPSQRVKPLCFRSNCAHGIAGSVCRIRLRILGAYNPIFGELLERVSLADFFVIRERLPFRGFPMPFVQVPLPYPLPQFPFLQILAGRSGASEFERSAGRYSRSYRELQQHFHPHLIPVLR